MTAKSAIAPSFSLMLDLIRAIAAVVVVIGHAGQLGLYSGDWPFSELLQHSAVIIFFILSGLVIADTARTRKSSARHYAIARVSRIVPVALAGILLGNAVWYLASLLSLNLVQPNGYNHPNLRSYLLPFVFLTELDAGAGPVANPPFWSLCYEVWYYALFGVVFFLRGFRRWALGLACLLLAGPRILILMPVWLAGVWLQSRISRSTLSLHQGTIFIFAGAVIVFFVTELTFGLSALSRAITGIGTSYWRHSEYWLADWMMIPGMSAIVLGLVPWSKAAGHRLERWRPAIRKAAGSSFTLYMVHWPILSLMVAYGIRTESAPGFVGVILGVIILAMALAELLEARATPAIRRWLHDTLPQPVSAEADTAHRSRSIAT